MFVHAEVVYGFYMPQDYDELNRFEAETDTTKMKKSEDTIATRYTVTVDATYPYKSKEPQKESMYDRYRDMEYDMALDQTDCSWK